MDQQLLLEEGRRTAHFVFVMKYLLLLLCFHYINITIAFETGTTVFTLGTSLDDSITQINLNNVYNDMIVVTDIVSSSSTYFQTSVESVTDDSFTVKLTTLEYQQASGIVLDQDITIHYVVVEKGERFVDTQGAKVVSGSSRATKGMVTSIKFDIPFYSWVADDIVVIGQIMMNDALILSIYQADHFGFDITLRSEELSSTSAEVTVMWIALPASTVDGVFSATKETAIAGTLQTGIVSWDINAISLSAVISASNSRNDLDPYLTRIINNGSSSITYEITEEQSLDSEQTHDTDEEIAIVIFDLSGLTDECCASTQTNQSVYMTGLVKVASGESLWVEYDRIFQDPVIVTAAYDPNGTLLNDPYQPQVAAVLPEGFGIYLMQFSYNIHSGEHYVSYIVSERGLEGLSSRVFSESNSKNISLIGNSNDVNAFTRIDFEREFDEVPVVLTQVLNFYYPPPFVRISSVSSTGFVMGAQIEELHQNENNFGLFLEVNYIAFNPSNNSGLFGAYTGSLGSENFAELQYDMIDSIVEGSSDLICIAMFQTYNDPDPAIASIQSLDPNQKTITVLAIEDVSLDDEISHDDETIGYVLVYAETGIISTIQEHNTEDPEIHWVWYVVVVLMLVITGLLYLKYMHDEKMDNNRSQRNSGKQKRPPTSRPVNLTSSSGGIAV